MKALSVFYGMSCGQLALEESNINIEQYFASEIKTHAIDITQHNFPETIQLGDVTKIKFEDKKIYYKGGHIDVNEIDLFIGGSPCQDFSRGNKERLGLDGEKSGLFEHWYRIFKEVEPKYFLLENVVMDKFDQRYISDLLGVEPIKINSELVSGQLRERLYWTNIGGTFTDLAGYNHSLIQQPKNQNIILKDIIECGYTPMKKARCLLESDSRPLKTPVKMFHRFYSTGFTTLIFKNRKHYSDCKKHYNQHYKGLSTDEFVLDNSIYEGVRYLNQSELEKLQTVKKGYTEKLSRNEAACLLGDGWTIDVIAHIFKHIKI